VEGAVLEDVDWGRAGQQLVAYCQRMEIAVPAPVDRDWMTERLLERDLAVRRNGSVGLTMAGCLLFSRRPHELVSSAQVVVRVGGEQERIFDGNWTTSWKLSERSTGPSASRVESPIPSTPTINWRSRSWWSTPSCIAATMRPSASSSR
jgi:hypothetical protein